MRRTEPTVLTNMCMITDGDRVLVQDRLDPNWPGIVFPGGHVEPQESFVESTIREVQEETGLTVSHLKLCGVKQFPGEKEKGRYIVFLFKTSTFTGELRSSGEGEVFWVDRKDLLTDYTLAEGFEEMLEVFENDDLSENYHWIEGEDDWHCRNL